MKNKPRRSSGRKAATRHGLPTISVDPRPLRYKSEDAIRALVRRNNPPHLFVRRGRLVRIREQEGIRPAIEILGEYELRGMLTRSANFVRTAGDRLIQVSPPMDVVRDVHTLGCWRFPDLEMIVEAPLLRPDGTILQVPGYDAQSKVIYAPAPGLRSRARQRSSAPSRTGS